MFLVLCVFSAATSAMFVQSVVSTISALRREQDDLKSLLKYSA